jgi:hypothetical protein
MTSMGSCRSYGAGLSFLGGRFYKHGAPNGAWALLPVKAASQMQQGRAYSAKTAYLSVRTVISLSAPIHYQIHPRGGSRTSEAGLILQSNCEQISMKLRAKCEQIALNEAAELLTSWKGRETEFPSPQPSPRGEGEPSDALLRILVLYQFH